MKKLLISVFSLSLLPWALLKTGNKSSHPRKKLENKELSLPLLTQSQENNLEKSSFTIVPTLSASSSPIIPSFQPDYNLLNQPQKQQSSHNFQRESLHSSLYYKAINKRAHGCIQQLKKLQATLADINPARGSLNIFDLTVEDLLSETHFYREGNKNELETKRATCLSNNPQWQDVEDRWKKLKEKMVMIESEISKLLAIGGASAAIALEGYYQEIYLLLYSILQNQENPNAIVNSIEDFSLQIDTTLLPKLTEELACPGGPFKCPHEGLKNALTEAQEEIYLWNKLGIPLTRPAMTSYIAILYGKVDYLTAGINLKPILEETANPQESAKEMIASIKLATETLKKIRIAHYPHTAT